VSVGTGATGPGFVGVLRLREFRVLWLADIQSLLGDQVARVALAVLVFDRTQSGLATAAVYGLTFLPALLGGVLLGGVADRVPRRTLLVGGDAARAVLLATMAIPHLPVTVLAVLLVVAVLIGAPWKAAETALVVDILPTRDHPVGLGLRSATNQGAQLAGFAVGGLTVAALGPQTALAVDAATFLVSAAVIRTGIRHRPTLPRPDPTATKTDTATRSRRRWWDGVTVVAADPRLRQLLALSWLLGLLVVPEGLAAPYAAELGADRTAPRTGAPRPTTASPHPLHRHPRHRHRRSTLNRDHQSGTRPNTRPASGSCSDTKQTVTDVGSWLVAEVVGACGSPRGLRLHCGGDRRLVGPASQRLSATTLPRSLLVHEPDR